MTTERRPLFVDASLFVDTNVLVYATVSHAPLHAVARTDFARFAHLIEIIPLHPAT
jgi:predicted nucleic acid-binding protein